MKIHGITVWQKTDMNGFFGLFTNNITNLIVLTNLLLYAAKFPPALVFGRVLPAACFAIFLCSGFYFYQGVLLAKREGRDTVTALPSGISVPHMFLIVFMIIIPVNTKTGNPVLAWQAGMAWCFIEGVIECVGAFVGPFVRRTFPRAALLGALAGVSITYILANGALQSFEVAYISFVSFAVILLGFLAKKNMPFHMPVGLIAILIGTAVGWLSGYMRPENLAAALEPLGFYPPVLSLSELWKGMAAASPFLISAVPMGIYNFLESIDNLESAEAAGDKYPTVPLLLADGITSMIGAVFGNVVPTAIYIGHAGWKSAGARIGYCMLSGFCVLLIGLFGIGSLLIAVVPVVAILPILIYIGMLMGSQAFLHVPKTHFPAVILGILPWLADWGKSLIGNAVSAAGGNLSTITMGAFTDSGIYYRGFEILGNGAIVIGIIWASLLVFMIERQTRKAVFLCIGAAVLTFLGFIHSTAMGIGREPGVVAAYLLVAAVILLFARSGYGPADE